MVKTEEPYLVNFIPLYLCRCAQAVPDEKDACAKVAQLLGENTNMKCTGNGFCNVVFRIYGKGTPFTIASGGRDEKSLLHRAGGRRGKAMTLQPVRQKKAKV